MSGTAVCPADEGLIQQPIVRLSVTLENGVLLAAELENDNTWDCIARLEPTVPAVVRSYPFPEKS